MGNSNIGNLSKVNSGDVHEFYEINKKEKLGSGATAVVRKAIRKSDGKVVAVKIINKNRLSADERKVVEAEVEILDRINHPNCVHLYETFETPKKLYLIMELLTGGELFMRIKIKGKFKESVAKESLTAMARALSYLHSLGITHRDLKPENLMYDNNGDDNQLKITDFGLAAIRPPGQLMHTACGTPAYSAPEILGRIEPAYSSCVDIWSLGVILYIMLCSFPPFASPTAAGLYRQIIKGKYDFPMPYWEGVSDAAKDLIGKMLTVDPAKRYTANQVLSHPWITGYSFSEIKAIADDEEEWDCRSCTFTNPSSARACVMCHCSRKGTVSVSPSNNIGWQCGACTFGNTAERDKCTMCASPRVQAGDVAAFFAATPVNNNNPPQTPERQTPREKNSSPVPVSPSPLSVAISPSPLAAATPLSASSPFSSPPPAHPTPSSASSSASPSTPASNSVRNPSPSTVSAGGAGPSGISIVVNASPMAHNQRASMDMKTPVKDNANAIRSASPANNAVGGGAGAGSPAGVPKFGVDVFGGLRNSISPKPPLQVIEEKRSPAPGKDKGKGGEEGSSSSSPSGRKSPEHNNTRKPISPALARKKDKFAKKVQQTLTDEQEIEAAKQEAEKARMRTLKGGWACPFCKYVNDKSAKKCMMCATMTEIVQDPV